MLIDDVGPGLEVVLEENIGPGIQAMLDEEFNAAVGETARVVSREVAIGTAQGLEEVGLVDTEDPTVVELIADRIVEMTEALGWIFWVLVIVFLGLFVVLIGWASRLIYQARDVKKKSDLRDENIARLAEAIQQIEEGGGESSELFRQVSQQIEDGDDDT